MKKNSLIISCLLFYFLSPAQENKITVFPNTITVLPANAAMAKNGLKTSSAQTAKETKVFAIQGWTNKEQSLTWNINVVEKGDYKIALLTQIKGLSTGAPVTFQLSGTKGKITLQHTNTPWDKLFFTETLMLDAGMNQLQLQLTGFPETEHPDVSVYSIELATEKTLEQTERRAKKLRSQPRWLDNADYGLFFHWNSRSKPRTGQPKTYADAVKDFDVTKFATTIHETGAKFIVLTTSWGGFTFPAPIRTAESIVPGSTTPRDLIADLSDALTKHNIKLLVYCNFRVDRMGLKKEEGFTAEKLDSAFDKMVSLYSEIALRYKRKIAGFWIDDGMALYPYNAPFERLTRAMKQANKDNVVCYNSWIYPRFTDFQDFFGGEFGINLKAAGVNDENLPVGGDGYFIAGGQKGLKATFCGQLEKDDWTHTELNKEISPPVLKSDELIKIMQEAMLRKNVAIMNVSVYQDGSISPETFDLLKQLNKAIHK